MRSFRWLILLIAVAATSLGSALSSIASAAPSVWSGLTYEFVRPTDVDHTLPQYQDFITPNVIISRVTSPGPTGGIFNAASETTYAFDLSPEYTLWATEFNNEDAPLIAVTEWDTLNFTDWRTAYGGGGALFPNILAVNAVVYLTLDDVYLDLKFTQWDQRGGGGFAYLRAVPVPEPSSGLLAAAGLLAIAMRRRRK